MLKNKKGLGYRHDVAIITIAPSKALLEPQDEGHGHDQNEEDNETVDPAQAPPHLRREGKLPKKVNLGSDEEPYRNMPPKERKLISILKAELRRVCVGIFRNFWSRPSCCHDPLSH